MRGGLPRRHPRPTRRQRLVPPCAPARLVPRQRAGRGGAARPLPVTAMKPHPWAPGAPGLGRWRGGGVAALWLLAALSRRVSPARRRPGSSRSREGEDNASVRRSSARAGPTARHRSAPGVCRVSSWAALVAGRSSWPGTTGCAALGAAKPRAVVREDGRCPSCRRPPSRNIWVRSRREAPTVDLRRRRHPCRRTGANTMPCSSDPGPLPLSAQALRGVADKAG
jgi:hypothetical protein